MDAPCCRVCGHIRHETVLSNYPAVGRSWGLIRCLSCGLVSTNPLPDDEILAAQYAEGYWATPSDRSAGVMYNMRMKSFARQLRRMDRSGNRALDVGAGNGAWVNLLRAHDFDAVGIDPYVAHSPRSPVLKCTLEEAPFEKASFDLVSFMHVLEHTKDPKATLKIACSLLKPGGLLVIEVPNIGSLGFALFKKRWFPLDDIPSHINHFSRRSLLHVIQESGAYDMVMDSGFSLKDSPSILTNTLFPGLSPRRVRKRYAGRHPVYWKAIYLLVQVAVLPAAWLSAKAGRGEVARLVMKKNIENK